ncbi:MAG: DUF2062 domain-containing protein [bacterium]
MRNSQTRKKVPWYDLKGQLIEIWTKLVSLNDSPHSVAFGLALGVFIGFLPIMGIQMAVVLLFAFPFKKANKVAAVAGVWITNPVTVIPIYAFIYWIGTFFYPAKDLLTAESLKRQMREVLQLDGFIDQTQAFLKLGADIFLPMCIGGAVIGALAMIPTYFITKTLLEKRKKSKERES